MTPTLRKSNQQVENIQKSIEAILLKKDEWIEQAKSILQFVPDSDKPIDENAQQAVETLELGRRTYQRLKRMTESLAAYGQKYETCRRAAEGVEATEMETDYVEFSERTKLMEVREELENTLTDLVSIIRLNEYTVSELKANQKEERIER